ncbi:MAG: hypothetical protein E7D69_11960 [Clostridium celatum]|nr:hypothetical protein [Clostridium celatum]
MLIKTIKGIIEKIKFKFKGVGNQEFVFESDIEVPFGDNEVDDIEEEYKSLNDISGVSAIDKDKLHLSRILSRTKKFRIRKKLVKRINRE